MNAVLNALKFRHACKKFDPERKISQADLDEILECGHLSPSSFGMEPWQFLVIQDDGLRQKLRPACWNQAQITDSSAVVVILTKPAIVRPGSAYVEGMFNRRNLPEEATKAYLQRYKEHMESEVEPRMSYYAWGAKQCYIALGNMMTGAAASGIDSCPIEGFQKEAVETVLAIDTDQYEVAVIFTLGYRLGEQTLCLRSPLNDIVEYR